MRRAGFALLTTLLVIAIFADVLAPYSFDQTGIGSKSFPILDPPSLAHLWGTTSLGMDVLSRVLLGTRTALIVVALSLIASLIWGLVLALMAAMFGGWIDKLFLFIADVALSIPSLLLGISIVFALSGGKSDFSAAVIATVLSEVLTFGSRYFRVLRLELLENLAEKYASSASVIGTPKARLIYRHVLPNSLSALPVLAAHNASNAVFTLAGLGFLGIGIHANAGAEWGYDLNLSLGDLQFGTWWTSLYPGIAVALAILAFGMLSESWGFRTRETSRIRS